MPLAKLRPGTASGQAGSPTEVLCRLHFGMHSEPLLAPVVIQGGVEARDR